MTPGHRLGELGNLPYGHRGPGRRASRPADSKYTHISSYFEPPPGDVENIPSLPAQKPNDDSVRSRIADTREPPTSFVSMTASHSYPSPTFFSTSRTSNPSESDYIFGPTNTAIRRQDVTPGSTTTSYGLRPLTSESQSRQDIQPWGPFLNEANHRDDVYGQ